MVHSKMEIGEVVSRECGIGDGLCSIPERVWIQFYNEHVLHSNLPIDREEEIGEC